MFIRKKIQLSVQNGMFFGTIPIKKKIEIQAVKLTLIDRKRI